MVKSGDNSYHVQKIPTTLDMKIIKCKVIKYKSSRMEILSSSIVVHKRVYKMDNIFI